MATKYVTLKDSNGDTLYPQAVATNLVPGNVTTAALADGAVTNAKTSATIIFNSVNTSGDVSLLDDVTSYDFIDIYGHEIGNRKISMRLGTPRVGNKFSLFAMFIGSNNTTLYWRGTTYEITDTTTITKTSDTGQFSLTASGNTVSGGGVNVYIDKIIGYK